MSSPRRNIGSIRKLPSGRYSATLNKYGVRVAAPHTFDSYNQASKWCQKTCNDLWAKKFAYQCQSIFPEELKPKSSFHATGLSHKLTLSQFAQSWFTENVLLRPKTRYEYARSLDKWFKISVEDKSLSDYQLGEINTPVVKKWLSTMAKVASPSTIDNSFRLLKTILNSAHAMGSIDKTPNLKGIHVYRSDKRPLITVGQLKQLYNNCPPEYALSVYLAGLCGLRSGEIFALTRKDFNLNSQTVTVEQTVMEVPGVGVIFGPPKTNAGRRTITYPDFLHKYILDHINTSLSENETELIFKNDLGGPITIQNKRAWWDKARSESGLNHIHFHDLRHFAATLAAQSGASLEELKSRLGHSSVNAVMRYQHATLDRDRAISDVISKNWEISA
jgi:integrase